MLSECGQRVLGGGVGEGVTQATRDVEQDDDGDVERIEPRLEIHLIIHRLVHLLYADTREIAEEGIVPAVDGSAQGLKAHGAERQDKAEHGHQLHVALDQRDAPDLHHVVPQGQLGRALVESRRKVVELKPAAALAEPNAAAELGAPPPLLIEDSLAVWVRDEVAVAQIDGQLEDGTLVLPALADRRQLALLPRQQLSCLLLIDQVVKHSHSGLGELGARRFQLFLARQALEDLATHRLGDQTSAQWRARALPHCVRKVKRPYNDRPAHQVEIAHHRLALRVVVKAVHREREHQVDVPVRPR